MHRSNFFEIVIVFVSGISIILNFILFKDWRGILYYTILSNLLVFIFYSIKLIKKRYGKLIKKDFYYMIKGLMIISILCTMFIYNFFMYGGDNVYTGHSLISSTVHLIVPVLVLLDYILFGKRKVLQYKYIFFWGLALIFYYFFIQIYSFFGGKFLNNKTFPYDILNYEINDPIKVVINCIVILLVYTVIGFCIVFINRNSKSKIIEEV